MNDQSSWGSQLDDVTVALAALTEALDREDELSSILQGVCRQVVLVVPDADMASVTLLHNDVPVTAASTDEKVRDLDADQYATGDGPCLEAAETGEIVRVDIASAHRRWPAFARAATEAGLGSYLCAPLGIDDQYTGALNLYGTQNHGFYHLDGRMLALYTTAVEAALLSTRRLYSARRTVEQLREALVSRPVIDQAKGILMAARGITADEAFDVLVEQSQRDNTKLRDIAEQFVRTVVRPQD